MAEDKRGKDKQGLDQFSEDLDSMLDDAMLDIDDSHINQQIGMIDQEDDIIDRLLIGDNYVQSEQADAQEVSTEIDAIIAEELNDQQHLQVDIDQFDEISSELPIITHRDEPPLITELDTLNSQAEIDTEALAISSNEIDLSDFADLLGSEPEPEPELEQQIAKRRSVIEEQAEIDISSDNALVNLDDDVELAVAPDTLLAEPIASAPFEFDISAEDDNVLTQKPNITEQAKPEQLIVAPELEAFFDDDATLTSEPEFKAIDISASEFNAEVEPEAVLTALANSQLNWQTLNDKTDAVAESIAHDDVQLAAHKAEIAELHQQVSGLKKQVLAFRQELTEKTNKTEFSSFIEEIESLKAEQKKSKRAIEAINNQKPILSYSSIAIAVTALLVGMGLGVQGYITKSQLTEISQMFVKLQEQVTTEPNNEAADKEITRKELEALSLADTVASNQIAELKKSINDDAAKPNADINKQLTDINNQTMQVGDSIEKLEIRVANLEKNRLPVPVAAIAKAEKKAVVVEENWAVNLIAFKQDWYANRKAEEYARQGVPAKVSKIVSKGEDWYRLSIDGFKSQYEAAGYAARIKKTLNLDAVWVAKAPPASKE